MFLSEKKLTRTKNAHLAADEPVKKCFRSQNQLGDTAKPYHSSVWILNFYEAMSLYILCVSPETWIILLQMHR